VEALINGSLHHITLHTGPKYSSQHYSHSVLVVAALLKLASTVIAGRPKVPSSRSFVIAQKTRVAIREKAGHQ
jgi:hypothetical protein